MPVCSTLFVGLGSPHGDDCVGWLVADALQESLAGQAIVRRAAAPLDILDWLEDIDRLALCDACHGLGPVGSWKRWEWPAPSLPLTRASGSHDLGLQEALNLAARLDRLPPKVILWGIEISSVAAGKGMTAAVAAAIPQVVHDAELILGPQPVRSICTNDRW